MYTSLHAANLSPYILIDHNGHRELSEADQNHVVDVLDSDLHHVDTLEGTDGIDGHSDSDHHSLSDERYDTAEDGRRHDPIDAMEVESLFGSEPGKHHQFDPDIYGDISQFELFDANRRTNKMLEEDKQFTYKRLGDTIWDAEIPDDDDPNLHVHTHFMNNYNPAEHPETFKPLIDPGFRRSEVQPKPVDDTKDDTKHEAMGWEGRNHHTDTRVRGNINEKEELDLHNKNKQYPDQSPDRHEQIDFSTISGDTENWGIEIN